MIKLYDSNITDILPPMFAKQESVVALGFAINQAIQRLIAYCRNTSVYAVIDSVPENVLDIMAIELNTQYYNDTLDIDTKRNLVKNTLIWYKHAGTPSAVEELIAVVFGEGEVKEWFEYGGKPYRFKIITNTLLTDDMITYFSKIIQRVKNIRSHIDAIEVHRTIDKKNYAGACVYSYYKPAAIIDGYNVDREVQQTIFVGAETDATIYRSIITE